MNEPHRSRGPVMRFLHRHILCITTSTSINLGMSDNEYLAYLS